MKHRSPSASQDGSSVVELLVAATLTVIAVALLAGDGLSAANLLESAVEPDLRELELVTAGEVAARAIRAARPGADRPPVSGEERRLTIVLGPRTALSLVLEDGMLSLSIDGEHPGSTPFPTGVLVAGLDVERSGFVVLDQADAFTADVSTSAAVAVILADGDHEVVRLVRPRIGTHLDGATAW